MKLKVKTLSYINTEEAEIETEIKEEEEVLEEAELIDLTLGKQEIIIEDEKFVLEDDPILTSSDEIELDSNSEIPTSYTEFQKSEIQETGEEFTLQTDLSSQEQKETKPAFNLYALNLETEQILRTTENLIQIVAIYMNAASDYEIFQLLGKYFPRLKYDSTFNRTLALNLFDTLNEKDLCFEGNKLLDVWKANFHEESIGFVLYGSKLMALFGIMEIEKNFSARLFCGIAGKANEFSNARSKANKNEYEQLVIRTVLYLAHIWDVWYSKQLYQKAQYKLIYSYSTTPKNIQFPNIISKFEIKKLRKKIAAEKNISLKEAEIYIKQKRLIPGFNFTGTGEKSRFYGKVYSEHCHEYDLQYKFEGKRTGEK